MDIRKYITKKNVIIGAVAGTAVIGGIVALAINHHKKKKDKELEERITQYHDAAERLLKELENGTYGK